MGLLDQQLAMDAVLAFTDPDLVPGAESVIYTKAVTGATRTIRAVVDRNPRQIAQTGGKLWTPRLVLTVANDSTYGITSAELNANGNDRVTVAERVGDTPRTFGVYLPPPGVAWCDAGMIQIELR